MKVASRKKRAEAALAKLVTELVNPHDFMSPERSLAIKTHLQTILDSLK